MHVDCGTKFCYVLDESEKKQTFKVSKVVKVNRDIIYNAFFWIN